MTKRALHCLVGLICLGPLASARPAEEPLPIELPDAIQRALERNPALAAVARQADASGFSIRAEEAGFRTQLRPAGGASVRDGATSVDGGLEARRKLSWGTEVLAGAGFVSTATPAAETDRLHRGRVWVGLEQPLFRNFGTLPAREALTQAESRATAARRRLYLAQSDLVVEVARAYLDLLRGAGEIALAEESAARMDKLLRLTQALERQGRTTRVDTLRVDAQRGAALLEVEEARSRYRAIMRELAELMGDAPSRVYAPAPVPAIEQPEFKPEAALRVAFAHRLDLAQIQQDLDDSLRGAALAQRSLLPDLRLSLQYERAGEDSRAPGASDLDEGTWFVGLTSGSDLLASRERAEAGRAAVAAEVAAHNVEVLARGITRQVLEQLDEQRRTASQLVIARRNQSIAQSRKDLAGRLFAVGRSDNLSVTDAERAYLEAERSRLLAETAAALTLYRLRRVLGTLMESPPELRPFRPGEFTLQ